MKREGDSTSSKRLENLFLLILFALGSVGSFYFFSQGNRNDQAQEVTHWQSDTRDQVAINTRLSSRGNGSQTSQLIIEGIPEAGVPLRFTIKDHARGGRYLLDMGNGEVALITEDHYSYTYRRPGTYRVKLEWVSKDSRKLLHSEFLNIVEGLEVAESGL